MVLETTIRHHTRRVVGPPPADRKITLYQVADVIYSLDGDWHDRADNTHSRQYTDAVSFAVFYNGDLLSEDALAGLWIHHCWDDMLGCPCCRDEAVMHISWALNLEEH